MAFFNRTNTRVENFQNVNQYIIELERKLGYVLKHIDITSIILGLANSRIVATDASGNLDTVSNLALWIAGTANRITVSDDGDGTITLNLPQDIHTDADVTFDSLTLDDLTPNRIVYVDGSDKLQSVSDLSTWIAGTADQITVSSDGDGTITLSLPQDINTNSDVTFNSMTLSNLTANRMVYADGSKVLQSIANLGSWIAGTTGNLTVTDDGDGSVTLKAIGSIVNVNEKTTTATLTVAEQGAIKCNSASDFTINLPTASGNTGLSYFITNINTNIVSILPNGNEILYGGTEFLLTADGEYFVDAGGDFVITDNNFELYEDENIQIVSDGSDWMVR